MVAVAKRKPSAFALRLRAFRDAAGYTQQEVADSVGVVVMTYIRWERGDTEPSYTELCKLAAVFAKTLNDFAPVEGEDKG